MTISTRFRFALLACLIAVIGQATALAFTPEELWNLWPEERFVTTPAPCLRHGELYERLTALAERYPGDLKLEEIGRSFQARPIFMLTLGRGPQKILLWSQMHGDEPSATPALLDIADYLLRHAEEPDIEAILDGVTLLMIPMLNPDGSEIYERRNAQAIDINRDALSLATPEGRILKRVREEHDPILGFNLHDQNRRTSVGDTGVLATNAVLAVAGDPEGTLTTERLRAKRACAAIVQALAPFMPGGMARYDEEWSPRAFGDNLTAWGTAVVLIESGGLPPGRELGELTRLNFVALLTVLKEFVLNDFADHDPEIYEALARNERDAWSDVAVRGGYMLQPGTRTSYRADLSFDLLRSDRHDAGCALGGVVQSRVVEIGDSRFMAAGRSVDAKGGLLVAPFTVGVEGWSARRWLDGTALARMARLGIGTVRWQVRKRRLVRAQALARALEARGRSRLEVVATPAQQVKLTLTALPTPPESDSLIDVLAALGGRRWQQRLAGRRALETLELLWPAAVARPTLRREEPASFLVLSPAVEGRIDPAETKLVSVWLDGLEISPEQ